MRLVYKVLIVLRAYGTDRLLPMAVAVPRSHVAIKTDPKAGSSIIIIGVGIERTGPVTYFARTPGIVIRKENGAVSITGFITCYEETYLAVH